MIFDDIGLCAPRILLPSPEARQTAWPVVACDQYTSQRSYWEAVDRLVGGSPSTRRMILPELYLEADDVDARIESVKASMHEYLDSGVLEEQPEGFVLVERTLADGSVRHGLVAALDLDRYDYSPGSGTLVRATEGTIVDRLPPRVRIRKDAPVELPHIMVLIDDPERTVIEPLVDRPFETAYDIELMMDSGRLIGRRVGEPATMQSVAEALRALADPAAFRARYDLPEGTPVLLYAMGDGNHSLATAKQVWESTRQSLDPSARATHPARWALVELVNVHSEALAFEPIHRVVFDCPGDRLIEAMARRADELGMTMQSLELADEAATLRALGTDDNGRQHVGMVAGGQFCEVVFGNPTANLPVGTLQQVLDDVLPTLGDPAIDYIHGHRVVTDLGGKPDNVGFYLPAMPKDELFRTVILDGALPRKTFSMGEADDKRFYMECRKIVP